ncbi:PTS sugar transporter subunit IIA [Enterococcus gilvus]|jgi:mannitol/fructose-specific phosphotransferase system IIA component (Ntr-type)|uniref:PTS sugar transporter subunit IIA n=1 Tax=Enterococcus gilvus TaxID=160453 RepID=UPI000DF5CFD5|nr:PTS sugar transporter subunit IIA [Enterococcus gilvus]AXG39359.1 PTS sugar transporter subunit IIA [Enterococcus gilvus]
MMNDKLFHVFLNQELTNKEQLQRFIAMFANPEEADALIDLLKQREKVGNTMIAEHVILPHLESPKIKQSQVLLIRLAAPVDLDEETSEVQLVVTILLKSQESQEIKKQIAQFTRRLADEDFLEALLTVESDTRFYQLLEDNH